VDPRAGFSAQGPPLEGATLDPSMHVTVRLSDPGVRWRLLSAEEAERFHLETPPSWVAEQYGPQPEPGALWGTWREHPKLRGRLLPDHPDDLQVIVHDGGPRMTSHAPEAVWVSVIGAEGDVFRARVLNQPFHLKRVSEGSQIQFIAPNADAQPVMVTQKYLQERDSWRIHPCVKCGFAELFDAPSDLIRATFPSMPAGGEVQAFTTRCPLCGGAQALEPLKSGQETDPSSISRPGEKRPWWRFWGRARAAMSIARTDREPGSSAPPVEESSR
jgi:hypothetical protein